MDMLLAVQKSDSQVHLHSELAGGPTFDETQVLSILRAAQRCLQHVNPLSKAQHLTDAKLAVPTGLIFRMCCVASNQLQLDLEKPHKEGSVPDARLSAVGVIWTLLNSNMQGLQVSVFSDRQAIHTSDVRIAVMQAAKIALVGCSRYPAKVWLNHLSSPAALIGMLEACFQAAPANNNDSGSSSIVGKGDPAIRTSTRSCISSANEGVSSIGVQASGQRVDSSSSSGSSSRSNSSGGISSCVSTTDPTPAFPKSIVQFLLAMRIVSIIHPRCADSLHSLILKNALAGDSSAMTSLVPPHQPCLEAEPTDPCMQLLQGRLHHVTLHTLLFMNRHKQAAVMGRNTDKDFCYVEDLVTRPNGPSQQAEVHQELHHTFQCARELARRNSVVFTKADRLPAHAFHALLLVSMKQLQDKFVREFTFGCCGLEPWI